MLNIAEAIKEATETLRSGGIINARKEAGSLLLLVLKKDRTFLIAHNEYVLTSAEEKRFWDFVKRRAKREPFQHIAGKQEFWGLDFIVSPDVLIPRPETEMIVETGIEILQGFEKPDFCEIGTGSGCISIALLHEVKKASALSVDISEKALQIAQINADNIGISERLELKISDVFDDLDKERKFNLIVSNPPYIPNDAIPNLQIEVREYDPLIALTDGKDGLSIIRKIVVESPKYLKPDGFLLLEIGFDQSMKVREMFDLNIWQNVDFLPDLQGIPRMVKAQI
jgi:release factor glutamine methyltransferase